MPTPPAAQTATATAGSATPTAKGKRTSGKVKGLLVKARESALQAVAIYNNPLTSFRSGAYIVLMIIAWTSLLLAILLRRGAKPYYRDKNNPRRYQKRDGDRVFWELGECARQVWPGGTNAAVVTNLTFMAELRNRIEHREMPELDLAVFGECQALLYNFEQLIDGEFGTPHSLTESLAMSLQFSRLRTAGASRSTRSLLKPLPKDIGTWVDTFRSALSLDVYASLEFSYRVYLVPQQISNKRDGAIAVDWISFDANDPSALSAHDKIATLIKQKLVPVFNQKLLLPGEVVASIKAKLPLFNTSHHTRCWKHYKVRPDTGSANPAACKTEYCYYDDLNKNYGYTQVWVDFLMKKLGDPNECQAVLGILQLA